MDNTRVEEQEQPCGLSTCSSGRTRDESPEFEFWMVRNPSAPQQDLISADELFVNGVLLPLDHLSLHQKEEEKQAESEPELSSAETSPLLTASKRWKDIFKKSDKKNTNQHGKDKDKKRKERKSQMGLVSSAELNINIWPFSRSRSAGTGTTPSRITTAMSSAGTRKVSSAPCSRSNSAGESKSRKWPSSPSRPGVHLSRTSPVWQVRRGRTSRNKEAVAAKSVRKKASGDQKGKVLNLKVPMCIGTYRHQLTCRSDENSGSHNGEESGGNSFSIRSFFTKKVY